MVKTVQNLLQEASDLYYNTGESLLADEVFDALNETEEVGFIPAGDKVRLPFRMYSLNKSYNGPPDLFNSANSIKAPKLDGAAIAILYDPDTGLYKQAMTRGDGEFGRDITKHVQVLIDLGKIPGQCFNVEQVTGEVVAKSSISNARNFVSGALNTSDPDEPKLSKLEFAAYGLFPINRASTFIDDMMYLEKSSFNTVLKSKVWDDYPKDGTVLRINDNELFSSLGYTAHHPRGAIALKVRKEGVVTTILSVSWQVGRTGVVTPVANLQEVDIDGASVKRASLHNTKFIKEMGIDIGDTVEVIRAGDIIPYIVRKVTQ